MAIIQIPLIARALASTFVVLSSILLAALFIYNGVSFQSPLFTFSRRSFFEPNYLCSRWSMTNSFKTPQTSSYYTPHLSSLLSSRSHLPSCSNLNLFNSRGNALDSIRRIQSIRKI